MLFDTHAHLDAEQFDADRDEVIAGLPGRGISLVVDPGCDLPSSPEGGGAGGAVSVYLRRRGHPPGGVHRVPGERSGRGAPSGGAA